MNSDGTVFKTNRGITVRLTSGAARELSGTPAEGADGQVNHAVVVNPSVVHVMVPAGVDVYLMSVQKI